MDSKTSGSGEVVQFLSYCRNSGRRGEIACQCKEARREIRMVFFIIDDDIFFTCELFVSLGVLQTILHFIIFAD